MMQEQEQREQREENPIIDILDAFSQEPPSLDFVWPGFLAGTVGGLIGAGGSGKSFFALEAAMSVVTGGMVDFLGLSPSRPGPVLYLATEDPAIVIRHRLHAIGKAIPQEMWRTIASNLVVVPLLGTPPDLFRQQDIDFLSTLADEGNPFRLIILDTLSRCHKLDENNNGDMALLITQLEKITVRTGAAVLFLHHVSKAALRDGDHGQTAARGASSLVDNSRYILSLQKMSVSESERLSDRMDRAPIGEGRRRFFTRVSVAKQNYATPIEDWWVAHQSGILKKIDLVPVKDKKGGKVYEIAAF